MQTSWFFILQYLITTFITGGGGSDFLYTQILASAEQISSFYLVLFQLRVSGSRHTYNFVSSKSGITLLLLNWKIVLTTLW